MAHIHADITTLIGRTPLVGIPRFSKNHALKATILVKLEAFNPGGSVKDRIAKAMVEDAEARGLLGEGSTIIEPTRGNTGIGLALMAAYRGYRVIPHDGRYLSISSARNLLKAYGAELVLTDGTKGMKGAIAESSGRRRYPPPDRSSPHSFQPGESSDTPAHHRRRALGRHRRKRLTSWWWESGTAARSAGAGIIPQIEKSRHQRSLRWNPQDRRCSSTGVPGPTRFQGIGAGFIPDTLDNRHSTMRS